MYEKGKTFKCEARTFKFESNAGKRTLTANFCETFNYEKCKHAQRLLKQ
jgi:hypothetical protein